MDLVTLTSYVLWIFTNIHGPIGEIWLQLQRSHDYLRIAIPEIFIPVNRELEDSVYMPKRPIQTIDDSFADVPEANNDESIKIDKIDLEEEVILNERQEYENNMDEMPVFWMQLCKSIKIVAYDNPRGLYLSYEKANKGRKHANSFNMVLVSQLLCALYLIALVIGVINMIIYLVCGLLNCLVNRFINKLFVKTLQISRFRNKLQTPRHLDATAQGLPLRYIENQMEALPVESHTDVESSIDSLQYIECSESLDVIHTSNSTSNNLFTSSSFQEEYDEQEECDGEIPLVAEAPDTEIQVSDFEEDEPVLKSEECDGDSDPDVMFTGESTQRSNAELSSRYIEENFYLLRKIIDFSKQHVQDDNFSSDSELLINVKKIREFLEFTSDSDNCVSNEESSEGSTPNYANIDSNDEQSLYTDHEDSDEAEGLAWLAENGQGDGAWRPKLILRKNTNNEFTAELSEIQYNTKQNQFNQEISIGELEDSEFEWLEKFYAIDVFSQTSSDEFDIQIESVIDMKSRNEHQNEAYPDLNGSEEKNLCQMVGVPKFSKNPLSISLPSCLINIPPLLCYSERTMMRRVISENDHGDCLLETEYPNTVSKFDDNRSELSLSTYDDDIPDLETPNNSMENYDLSTEFETVLKISDENVQNETKMSPYYPEYEDGNWVDWALETSRSIELKQILNIEDLDIPLDSDLSSVSSDELIQRLKDLDEMAVNDEETSADSAARKSYSKPEEPKKSSFTQPNVKPLTNINIGCHRTLETEEIEENICKRGVEFLESSQASAGNSKVGSKKVRLTSSDRRTDRF